jgi:hypothetical protein
LKKLFPVLVIALCAALIGVGCGGDDDETTTATTTTGATGATGATGESGGGLLPDDFAAQADAICREGDAKIDSEAQKFFGNSQQEPKPADQEDFVTDAVVPGIQDQIDQLSALDEPDEGAEEWSTFLADAQTALDQVEKDPSLLTDQFSDQNAEDPFADVETQAQELGLVACASDSEDEEDEASGGGGTADAGAG